MVARKGQGESPAEAPASSAALTDSDGWETVYKESAAVVIFDTIGDTFVGIYDGEEHIHPDSAADDSEDFDRFVFDGVGEQEGTRFAINQSYTLREAMSKVKLGDLCRIVYIKDVPTKRALNPLKDFRVDVKRG